MLCSGRDHTAVLPEFRLPGCTSGTAPVVAPPAHSVVVTAAAGALSRQREEKGRCVVTDVPSDSWAFGSGGFAKLYGDRLADSSLLDEALETRWIFVWMLSQADHAGRYRCASVASLSRASNVTRAQAKRAVETLEAPDPNSTTPDNDGKRIERIAGGWQILNYQKYREFRTEKQIKDAERQQRHRESQRDTSRDVTVTPRDIRTRGQRTEDRDLAKKDLSLLVPTKPVSKVYAESSGELPANPFKFIAYWHDADEKRDFGVTFHPNAKAFAEFVVAEYQRLNGPGYEREVLRDETKRSLTRFAATYSKRSRGKTRGSRLKPQTLTEELVSWMKKDLSQLASRQSKKKTRANRIDEQTRRLMNE